MKKENLSTMTVKTLLAVVIFTGIGTVIIGGGYIIWEYSKITNGNKTIQLISSDQELIHLQKSFNISIADSDYKIVEKNNLHLIKISGHGFYEYRHKEKPVLPARTIQLRIPSNATINSVFIKGSNPVDLSVFNIPALNPKYDKYDYKSELREPFYVEMPASIGLFDPINNPTWFDGGRGITAKTVSVDVIPVIVNAKTKNVVFYKDLIVTVYYETEQKGILDYIFSNKGSRLVRKFYDIDEEVLVFTVIENITKDKASFNIHGKITTTTKEEVASVNKHVIINPEDTAEVKLNFGKIDIPGAYFLKIDAYDSTGKIGVIERPFSVRPNKYRNEEFGFEVVLLDSWAGYSILTESWDGISLDNNSTKYEGPKIIIRNPNWSDNEVWQDIPILVFTKYEWQLVEQRNLNISAAPVGPKKLGENNKYIFVLPPRWVGFSDALGQNEAQEIIKTFKAISFSLNDISDWQTYRNEEFGFEMKYPEDWFVYERSDQKRVYIQTTEGHVSKATMQSDLKRIWIGYSFDELSEQNEDYLKKYPGIKKYSIKNGEILMNVYEYKDIDMGEMMIFAYWTKDNNNYLARSGSEVGQKNAKEQVTILKQMLSTFKFIEN